MTLRKWSDLTDDQRADALDQCQAQMPNHLRNRIKVDVRSLAAEVTIYERETQPSPAYRPNRNEYDPMSLAALIIGIRERGHMPVPDESGEPT